MFKFKPFKVYNKESDELIYAQGQFTTEQYKTLREFLHVPENQAIQFPHGARMIVRGGNWYKIEPNNPVRGRDKVFFALRVLRLCEQEQRLLERKAQTETSPGVENGA